MVCLLKLQSLLSSVPYSLIILLCQQKIILPNMLLSMIQAGSSLRSTALESSLTVPYPSFQEISTLARCCHLQDTIPTTSTSLQWHGTQPGVKSQTLSSSLPLL